MTRTEIMALDGLALREAVCERLGIAPERTVWCVGNVERQNVCISYESQVDAQQWVDAHQAYASDNGYTVYPYPILPAVESSLDAARLVEDEVERRGLEWEYISRLREIVEAWDDSCDDFWDVRRATPAKICKAALLAKEGL